VAFYADSGGKAAAVLTPVHGRARVARFILGLVRHASAHQSQIERILVNGETGARLVDQNGDVIAVVALDISTGVVQSVFNVVNPDKLGRLTAPGGHGASDRAE
jgi:RNA polymerase sigma-70 factor, ECF subfamily